MIERTPAVWLQSIQHGLIATLPVVMLGALSLATLQLLVWLSPAFDYTEFSVIGEVLQQACYGLMAVILVLSISQKLAQHYQQLYSLNIDPLIVAILSMVTLVAIVHLDYGPEFYLHLGVTAVAKGIFCSIVFTELYVFLYRRRIFNLTRLNESIDPTLLSAINATWPAIVVPCVILIIYMFISDGINQLSFLFSSFIGSVDDHSGFTLWQTIKLILVNQLSWFMGIHGASILEIQASSIYPADASVVYSRQFMNMFVHIGGAGCTFGLVVALLFSKIKESKMLGRYGLFPAIFNINELLIFGLPIIFNRYLIIPFVMVPIVIACLCRTVFELELVEWNGGAESWSTPVLLGGYLATGQWQGIVLQLVCIFLSASLYWPFLTRYEKNRYFIANNQQSKMLKALNYEEDLSAVYQSKSSLGDFCRFLLLELDDAIENNKLDIYYQAKVDVNGKVVGAEALLRWNHPRLGFISPGVIVPLAELGGRINELGSWVIQGCLSDMSVLSREGVSGVKIAINVSPIQLESETFFNDLISMVDKSKINPKRIEFEITEGQKIKLDDRVLAGLKRLSDHGFSIAIDDFGMGYTSLRYLKSFPVNTLKIDGSIICDVMDSKAVQEIIASMGQLAMSMDVQLVAEWVEEDRQMEKLIQLGCHQFQGYLMSEAVCLADFTQYCGITGFTDESPE
jgi:PTS system cellobiose-specific IIC component